jgi:hypothetical protein
MSDIEVPEPTEQELDALAEVSPEDQERAAAWWKRNAPKGYANLLDAEEVPPIELEVE